MKTIEEKSEYICTEIESVISNTIDLEESEYELLTGQLAHLFVDLLIEEYDEIENEDMKSFYSKLKERLSDFISQYY
jgi:glucan biosynthesis protein